MSLQTPIPLPMQIQPPLAVDNRMAILAKLVLENCFVDINSGGADLSKVLVTLVDIVPANVLPFLAEQWRMLGPAGWEFAKNEAEQRALLREAIALHRIKGTRYAVVRALSLLGLYADIEEWFETSPRKAPYTFTININPDLQPEDSPPMDAVRLGQVASMVNYWKNARSGFSFAMQANIASLGMGVALAAVGCEAIPPLTNATLTAPRDSATFTLAVGLIGNGQAVANIRTASFEL